MILNKKTFHELCLFEIAFKTHYSFNLNNTLFIPDTYDVKDSV